MINLFLAHKMHDPLEEFYQRYIGPRGNSLETYALRYSTIFLSLLVIPIGIICYATDPLSVKICLNWKSALFCFSGVSGIIVSLVVEDRYQAQKRALNFGAKQQVMRRFCSIPEELIRIKAHANWKERQSDGVEGTPEEDWIKAREYFKWHCWEVFQWKLTQRLSKRPMKLIAEVTIVTIILSLGAWILSMPERREDEIFATWQVVNEASEDQSGVVKIALERLLRNNFSLAGLELKNTNLEGANLQEANLRGANLQEASLRDANLQEAYLEGANLQEANLRGANLQKSYLGDVNFQETKRIKSACFWDKAIYKGEWNNKTKTAVVTEPDNTNFIEGLKKDKSSDLKEKPDCSRWRK